MRKKEDGSESITTSLYLRCDTTNPRQQRERISRTGFSFCLGLVVSRAIPCSADHTDNGALHIETLSSFSFTLLPDKRVEHHELRLALDMEHTWPEIDCWPAWWYPHQL